MPLRVESRLWTLGVISCEIIRTLPSPNAIAKPPASGPPKIVGADTFFASCRRASPPKRVLLLE
jgi:hypothetical protein